MQRIKTASTIIAFPAGKEVTIYNYLTKDAVSCGPHDVYWLTVAVEWLAVDKLFEMHPHISQEEILTIVDTLVSTGMLLVEDSVHASKDAQYKSDWELGPMSAAFHFTTFNYDFMNLEESVVAQKQKMLDKPSPSLFMRNSDGAIDLKPLSAKRSSPLIEIMRKRRTNRDVEKEAIPLDSLAAMLFAGLGITGLVKTDVAVLPLKMTPSGGARNPYEAYVWVRSVEGLSSGIYHYSAFDNSLEKMREAPNVAPSEVLKGQDWADDMSAVVFLVSYLDRTSWKYADDYAYRAILIEAGHIGQNMMLQCAEGNLTACPTAAFDHVAIGDILGLKGIMQFPVYSLLVGRPKISLDVVYPVSEFERLEQMLRLETMAA